MTDIMIPFSRFSQGSIDKENNIYVCHGSGAISCWVCLLIDVSWLGLVCTGDGQVDTRALVRTDRWYGSEKAWPIWSFVTRAYVGAIDRDLSWDTTNAEINTDAVSNVQLGIVQLYVILIMLCTGRALDCAVSAMYSCGMKAWRMFCHAYALWNDARLVVLMLEVLAILLETKDAESFWMLDASQ